MNRYLLQYKRDIHVETENSHDDYGENVTVSFFRDAINAKLVVDNLNNK